MTRNPYVPPTTPVADLPADGSIIGSDRHVVRACQLLWLSFGATLLASAFRPTLPYDPRSIVARTIGAAIGGLLAFLVIWWLTAKLRAGRNWMRLLITIFQIGVLASIPLFWSFTWSVYKPLLISDVGGTLTYVVIAGIQWVLSLAAAVLINTPEARSWFGAMKQGARN